MNKIASALLKAKRSFNPVLKDKANPAFRGSKYADLAACLDAVDQPCLDNGIVLYQETSEDATGVTVETVFLHESGEALRCGKLHVPASKNDAQGYGSALSYARRYSLLAACGIAAEDDDGNAAQRKPGATGRAPAQQDNSAKARAHRIAAGVAAGDAAGAAEAMTQWPQDEIDAVWNLLPADVTDKLKAAWPQVPA